LYQNRSNHAAHCEYFDYLNLLLDHAALRDCNIHQYTSVKSDTTMVAELQALNPAAPWLNGVVLGRLAHRLFPGLVTWHSVQHVVWCKSHGVPLHLVTTIYRFPEAIRARQFFGLYLNFDLA
jgi:hypothetical protein